MKWTHSTLLFVLLVQGCAFTQQEVTLQPDVKVENKNKVHGSKIYLKTVDERSSTSIGTRGVSGFGAEITSNDDIAMIVHTAVSGALKDHGFDVISNKDGSPVELRAEVRNLEYTLKPGIFMGTLRTESLIKGICSIEKDVRYEYLYRGGSEKKVFVAQFAEENAKHINMALSESIQNMIQDSELMSCLKQREDL